MSCSGSRYEGEIAPARRRRQLLQVSILAYRSIRPTG